MKLASRPNLEFLEANRAELPSLAEIKACYAHRRQQCNQALHPKKGISRLQLYQQSTNSQAPAVSPWERVDWFWVLRPTPVTSKACAAPPLRGSTRQSPAKRRHPQKRKVNQI